MPRLGEDSRVRLYNEDCLKVLPKIAGGSIDLVLTDPPYGTTQCRWDSVIPLARMWAELTRVARVCDGKRYPQNIIKIKGDERGTVGRLHPTQKPVELMSYLIRTYSNPGDLVLDFTMGIGSTGVACKNLGRRFIGIENDTEHGYFSVAQKRIKEATCLG